MQSVLAPGALSTLAVGAHQSSSASLHDSTLAFSVAAQSTTTATVAITPSVGATGTTTVTLATPPPLPSSTSAPLSVRWNPLDWNYLTSRADPNMGPFAWIFTALLVALLAFSLYIYFVKRNEWKRTNSVYRRAAQRWAPWGIWLPGLALVFVLFRLIRIDLLDFHLWLYLWLFAILGVAGWFYYWYRTRLPQELARHQKTMRQRQYMPNVKKSDRMPAVKRAEANNVAGTVTTPVATPPAPRPASRKRRRK